jgi:DNA-binding PadR family transcriptional regulator
MRGASSPVTGALLGLLLERPSYGYELAQRMNERFGPAWSLTTSSIYPVLDRLESEELIRRAVKDLPGRARQRERVMYHATDQAHQAFEEWMSRPVRREPIRAELLAKLAVARPQDAPLLLAALDEYERACLRLLEAASEAQRSAEPWDTLLIDLINDAADQHLRADLAWVASARRRLSAYLREGPRG